MKELQTSVPVLFEGGSIGKAIGPGQAAWLINEELHKRGVQGNHISGRHLQLCLGSEPRWERKQ